MEARKQNRFIKFLREELALSSSAIDLAMRHSEQNSAPLPIILWQYGLVTISQLDQIFDWLENA
jgi:hypothetical protein